MPPASPAPASDSPSALRVGLSAGKSVLGGLMLGIFLAIVLGCTTAIYYFMRLNGPGMPAAAHAGGFGAIVALIFTPSLWPAIVLVFVIPAYVMVGLMIGRARATGKLVARYGQGLAQRLAEVLAKRIESMPRTHKALHKAADWVTPEVAIEHLRPWVGDGRVVQFVVRTVLKRLPLADMLEEWGHKRGELGGEAVRDDPALRAYLGEKIYGLLEEMAEPPWTLLWLLMGVNFVALALGIWLTS